MSIHLLDDHLINKIAAGEVIERPASVVKELLDNAIDAGATSIGVSIVGGGIKRIIVEDNGAGMSHADLSLAFLRHATSKIENEADLFRINTMGFRGEALPSIAAVARVEVYTARQQEGFYACIEKGQVSTIEPYAWPAGTRMVINELFYNTPARRKFLKSPVSEGNAIYEMVCRYVLARPDISFTYQNDKKTFFKSPGNGLWRETVAALYGADYSERLLGINYQGDNYSVSGLVSSPDFTRGNRKNQFFFVNRRPIRSPMLFKAIDTAYKGLLVSREYPVVILSLEIPMHLVDVNVHPQKTEVRFSDESAIFSMVSKIVRQKIWVQDQQAVFKNVVNNEKPSSPVFSGRPGYKHQTLDQFGFPPQQVAEAQFNMALPYVDQEREVVEDGYRIIGQVMDTYILLEKGNDLWIVDQHAAHERILYEGIKRNNSRGEPGQQLIMPIPIELATPQMDLLELNQPLLQQLGFDLQVIGNNTMLLRAGPASMRGCEVDIIFDILDLLENGKDIDLHNAACISMACRKAVKAGDRLTGREMGTIIDTLYSLEMYRTCPHGRPTMIKLERRDLDRMFKR
ncbi:DNA mismatch repair endonuclease MutL [Syntrophomonas erecta]